mgnify:FL=1
MTAARVMAEFDDLMERAESAALGLNGPELGSITTEIEGWSLKLEKMSPDKEFLMHVRSGMVRFREICRFVGDTMQDAFASATAGPGNETKKMYGGNAKLDSRRAEAVLLRQYG